MLIWRKSSSIDIDIWINLDWCDSESTSLEYSADATCNDSFPYTTDYSARHQNVLHPPTIVTLLNFNVQHRKEEKYTTVVL